jgi:hypothetical protein
MPNTVHKPDINPVISALLTAFVFNLGHFLTNGQQRKWLMTLIAIVVGSILCCVPGCIVWILSVIDSYQTARRLEKDETIPENEYSQPFLFKIVRLIDKTATCSRAS